MNIFDVLYLDIYKSIRGDWSMDVDLRGQYLLKLLPVTTLPDDTKEELQVHFRQMIEHWKKHEESKKIPGITIMSDDYVDFDGRSWARGYALGYNTLMETPWFDKAFYEQWSLEQCGSFSL